MSHTQTGDEHEHGHEDEKEKNLTHGFEIHAEDHHHALEYMATHMNAKQVEDMVDRAKKGHSADFMVKNEGREGNYKLSYHDGKLKIHDARH